MQIISAHDSAHLATIRELFLEYARAIEVDLCFQGFDLELAELPGKYAPPSGRLLLALEDGAPAGCVALRKIDDGVCEMKRLYVRPAFRGRGLGRNLTMEIISAGRAIEYERMRLDTLKTMREAVALYESLGFQRIPAYYDNPSNLAVFLELKLYAFPVG